MPNTSDILWFKQQFGDRIKASLGGSPFDLDMLVAIACQETGYIWSVLRKKDLSTEKILALCVGDTIDAPSRQAFPKSEGHLIAKPNGTQMFNIARKALVDMAEYISGYQGVAHNPNKFCHGFGVFQRDLQFFLDDQSYFLNRKYENFEDTLAQCLGELRRGLKILHFQDRTSISDLEFAYVAIAYNTGRFKANKGLKQGHFNGSRYYGEEVYDFVLLSRRVGATPGRFVVAAAGGLNLRKGPGIGFGIAKTLEPGTELSVLGFDGSDGEWARVDLEGDGLVDGHAFALFLKPAAANEPTTEDVEEPGEAA